MTSLDCVLKSRDIILQTKFCLAKAMVFPVVMYGCWELDYKESWAPKNWCFWTVVLEKTLESPLDCKEIKLVSPKGNQPWIFTGGTDAEAEAPILWPPDAKSWLVAKDPVAGKDWRQSKTGQQRRRWLDGFSSNGFGWKCSGGWFTWFYVLQRVVPRPVTSASLGMLAMQNLQTLSRLTKAEAWEIRPFIAFYTWYRKYLWSSFFLSLE